MLESLPLRMVEIESRDETNEDWRADYFDWDQLGARTRPELGDCYAMMAEFILTIKQPYPRDERYCPIEPLYKRFEITKCTPSSYLIANQMTGFLIKVAKAHLANPHFDIRGWYVHQQNKVLNLPQERVMPYQMGSALDYVATWLLTNAIATHFPLVNPDLDLESWFYVHQKDFGSIDYIVEDLDFELQTRISKQWLEEPTFNLVHYLEFEHRYSERYEAKQQELYGDQTLLSLSDVEIGFTGTTSGETEQEWDKVYSPAPHCSCSQKSNHEVVACPDLKSVSDSLLFRDIPEFDWDHTDNHRDKWCWPSDETISPKGDPIHDYPWIHEFIGNTHAECLNKILIKCQLYPGDNEFGESYLCTINYMFPY